MTFISTLFRGALTGLLLAASCVTAHAQAFPTRPIHVVFPFPPGSPPDAIGRLLVERAGKILGQPMIFENKPGANGILGTTQAARATPDGYTIHLTTTSAFLLNPFLRKDLPYDVARSFTPVVPLVEIPVALIVSSRVPVNTTPEFIRYLKANPGKVAYSSIGNGSFIHLLMEQFKSVAGVDMLHVPYPGASAAANELLAGRVDATILAVRGPWAPEQVRILSMMSTRRSPAQPNVRAITEELPGFRPFGNWMGVFAPAETPAPIVRQLADAFNAVLQQPDVRGKIEEQQWTVLGGSPEEFRTMIASDLGVVGAAVRSAGIKPE